MTDLELIVLGLAEENGWVVHRFWHVTWGDPNGAFCFSKPDRDFRIVFTLRTFRETIAVHVLPLNDNLGATISYGTFEEEIAEVDRLMALSHFDISHLPAIKFNEMDDLVRLTVIG